ncbi:MAG: hypothetical protein KAZ26_24245 [Caldilineaceae bacterium]|nr:hypothetical protein [Caldilineaceae bacterium]
MKIISLGWGVQSWVLAAMSALDELPKVDFAIHSDTTWERSATYDFAQQWTPWLERRGVKVITVGNPEQAERVYTNKTDIPAFTLDGEGGRGQLRRQCTSRWKIQPMRRLISEELLARGLNKDAGVVEQWLGITLDEWHRAKDSDVQYITHKFPLLDLKMTRADCAGWLQKHDLPMPIKSSCTFCPYHSVGAWEQLKRDGGKDWAEAVEIDAKIRDARPPFPLFVHPARIPLEEAVSIPEDAGAMQLGLSIPDEECDSGYCFL